MEMVAAVMFLNEAWRPQPYKRNVSGFVNNRTGTTGRLLRVLMLSGYCDDDLSNLLGA